MIAWIKFTESQPEQEGFYLYWNIGTPVPRIAEWVNHRNASCFCHPERSPLEVLKIPDYWAEINFPVKEPPMSEKRLCKDCKWIVGDCLGREDHEHALCKEPRSFHSPVDGLPIQACYDMRNDGSRGLTVLQQMKRPEVCGPEGRWFEAKE